MTASAAERELHGTTFDPTTSGASLALSSAFHLMGTAWRCHEEATGMRPLDPNGGADAEPPTRDDAGVQLRDNVSTIATAWLALGDLLLLAA